MNIEEAMKILSVEKSISFEIKVDDQVFSTYRRSKDGKWERYVSGYMIAISEGQANVLENAFKEWLDANA